MTTQREQLKDRLYKISLQDMKVIDWGSGAKPVVKYIDHKGCSWLCLDKNKDIIDYYKQFNVEYRVCDIEAKTIYLPTKYDVAFCLEVLEHTLEPKNVIENIYNSLKDNGKLYLSVPFMFPIHSDEDYWRFTENGLRYLLKDFSQVYVETLEDETGYWVGAIK